MKKLIIFQVLITLFIPQIFGEARTISGNAAPGLVLTAISPDKNNEIKANMRQAQHYMEKGDYVSAKKKLERVLELDEEHAEALRLLEVCNEMIEQQRETEREALQEAIDAGNVKALQDFIAQYPKSEFVSQAEGCIEDFELWDVARRKDTKAAYQYYLSASRRLGYKDEAEAAIYRIEAEEAWSGCHNSNSMAKLESYLDKYAGSAHVEEAKYELNLLKAEKYYNQNSRALALSCYEKANAYCALTGAHKKNYDELVLEATYESLKESSNLTDLQNFLKRLTLDSPYYNTISNRIAVVKAQRLTISSTQIEMDVALSYAKDEKTENVVKQYITNVKKRQRENRKEVRKSKRKAWWEDRATFGLGLVSADLDPSVFSSSKTLSKPSTFSLSAGLRLRFGRYNDIFNLTLGADYQNYWGKYVTTIDNGYYEEEETHYSTINRRLAFPVNVKINIPFKHSNGAFYFGFTSEFGYEINDVLSYFKQINKFEDVLNWQKPSIAIEPQMGFNHKHFEWGFYYKYYLKGYRFFESDYSEEYLNGFNRFGISMSVYF